MRLLAAALATATLLGTGCYSSSDPAPPAPVDTHVYWRFLRFAPAQPGDWVYYDDDGYLGTGTGRCPDSYVDTVRVDAGYAYWDGPCTYSGVQGMTVALAPGPNTLVVTGYRESTPVYRSTVNVNVTAPESQVYADVEGIAAPLELYAYMTYANPAPGGYYASCGLAGSPNFGYSLYDSFGTLIQTDLRGCSEPQPAIVRAATPWLDLDNYTLRMSGYSDLGATEVFGTVGCTTDFDHFGAQVGVDGVAATLQTLPVPNCPSPLP